MAHVITILSQAQNVGKTTTAVNLAASLALADKSVLLVDLDPKCDATRLLGYLRGDYKGNIVQVLIERKDITEVLLPTSLNNLTLLPSSAELIDIEFILTERSDGLSLFVDNLKYNSNEYDFILFDCSTSCGILNINVLKITETVIVPFKNGQSEMSYHISTLRLIDLVKKNSVIKLKRKICILNLHSNYENDLGFTMTQLKHLFGEDFFQTPVPHSRQITEAASQGCPIVLYDIASSGAVAYMNLAACFLA